MSSDLNPDETVTLAARWIIERDPAGRAVIPEIKTRFGLTALEACEAARIAQQIRNREMGGANAS